MKKSNATNSRRKFLTQTGMAGLGFTLLPSSLVKALESFSTVKKEKLGIALVGLGGYATNQLAPALQMAEHCYLAGIVTGTPSKAVDWKQKYAIPEKNIYNYENFDSIRDNPDIDIVYVVLPNFMHAEYTVRAAQAGKHVICEKPMAISVEECDQMIAACKKAGKMLSIGYRLHFDPYHLEIARLGKERVWGKVLSFESNFAFNAKKGIWRLDKKIAGGGALMDLGIYCLQAACYSTGMEPIAVTAKNSQAIDPEKYIGIEQMLEFELEFPDGTKALCKTNYTDSVNNMTIHAEKGDYGLVGGFGYNNIRGNTPSGPLTYAPMNQQTKQMDAFALSVKTKTPSIVPGEMGRRDLKIIEAIYKSLESGSKEKIRK